MGIVDTWHATINFYFMIGYVKKNLQKFTKLLQLNYFVLFLRIDFFYALSAYLISYVHVRMDYVKQ